MFSSMPMINGGAIKAMIDRGRTVAANGGRAQAAASQLFDRVQPAPLCVIERGGREGARARRDKSPLRRVERQRTRGR